MAILEKKAEDLVEEVDEDDKVERLDDIKKHVTASRVEERLARKKMERTTYLVAAIMSSVGITSMAAMAVYYRFAWQMEVLNILING